MKRYNLRVIFFLLFFSAISSFSFSKFSPNVFAQDQKTEGFVQGLLRGTLEGLTDVFGLNPAKDLKKALYRSPSEWDEDILASEKIDWQISSLYKVVGKSFLQEKCQEIAEKIIKQTPYPGLPIKVKIINSTEVNAFTTGGKYVYVNSGLVANVPSEDALAFIIGHEIGHIMARHVKRKQKGEMWGDLMVILSKPKNLQELNAIKKLANCRYSQQFEKEADTLGAIFAYKAGYDVEEGAKFFLKQWKEEEQRKQRLLLSGNTQAYIKAMINKMFFASHPPLPERIKLLRQTKRVLRGEENTHPLAYVFNCLGEPRREENAVSGHGQELTPLSKIPEDKVKLEQNRALLQSKQLWYHIATVEEKPIAVTFQSKRNIYTVFPSAIHFSHYTAHLIVYDLTHRKMMTPTAFKKVKVLENDENSKAIEVTICLGDKDNRLVNDYELTMVLVVNRIYPCLSVEEKLLYKGKESVLATLELWIRGSFKYYIYPEWTQIERKNLETDGTEVDKPIKLGRGIYPWLWTGDTEGNGLGIITEDILAKRPIHNNFEIVIMSPKKKLSYGEFIHSGLILLPTTREERKYRGIMSIYKKITEKWE